MLVVTKAFFFIFSRTSGTANLQYQGIVIFFLLFQVSLVVVPGKYLQVLNLSALTGYHHHSPDRDLGLVYITRVLVICGIYTQITIFFQSSLGTFANVHHLSLDHILIIWHIDHFYKLFSNLIHLYREILRINDDIFFILLKLHSSPNNKQMM